MVDVIRPNGQNALLVTRRGDGEKVKTFLRVTDFRFDVQLQISTAQTRRGKVYRPIRFQERVIDFTAIWNVVTDRKDYDKFTRTLINHWSYTLNGAGNSPMEFTYFGLPNRRHFTGNIEKVSTGAAWNDVTRSRKFQMKVHTKESDGARYVGPPSPLVPTSADVEEYGHEWFTAKELEHLLLPKTGSRGGRDDKEEERRRGVHTRTRSGRTIVILAGTFASNDDVVGV